MHKATGKQDGFQHLLSPGLRVCQKCRKRPLDSTPESAPKLRRVQWARRPAHADEGVDLWQQDTMEGLYAEFKHTVIKPQIYTRERWELAVRVIHMYEQRHPDMECATDKTGQPRVTLICNHPQVKSLGLSRQKLCRTHALYLEVEDKASLARALPQEFQVGRQRCMLPPPEPCNDLTPYVTTFHNLVCGWPVHHAAWETHRFSDFE